MSDGMNSLVEENNRLTRERDEAREEVVASLDALMTLQIKYDEDTEDLKSIAKIYFTGMWIVTAILGLCAVATWMM